MKKQIREVLVADLAKYFLLPLLILSFLWTVFALFLVSRGPLIMWIALFASVTITVLLLKRFLIGLVLMYKAFAPLGMRSQCRFEPTCSTYMIMVLRKYGPIIGLIKGICRIIRCRPPNGGIDYP